MNKTVLIIDDDELLRKTLSRGLQGAGFNVLTAPDTDTAYDFLTRIKVDAIVLDRMMVGTDGLTFLKQLRAMGNNTPTIMLTAMSGTENIIDGLSGGADDYLTKPFQFQELVLRINNITKHSVVPTIKMPKGLSYVDGEFFIQTTKDATPSLIALSGEEKKLLYNLTHPLGSTAPASPMVAKRLRNKLNVVSSELDIITIRNQGYKLVCSTNDTEQKD